MKNDQYIYSTHRETAQHNTYNREQGRVLYALLPVLGFALLAAIALYFVVLASQQLDVPKDTEVGIMAVVATVTLLAILGQIFVTVLQWRAMRDALQYSEIALTVSERAYITVRKIKLTKALKVDENPAIKMEIVNGGRTPARDVYGNYTSAINDRDLPEVLLQDFEPKKPKPREIVGRIGTLFANEFHEQTSDLPGLITSPEWRKALPGIMKGAVPFYVLCNVNFTDFQDKKRVFQLIAFYDERTDEFIECGSRDLLFNTENSAT